MIGECSLYTEAACQQLWRKSEVYWGALWALVGLVTGCGLLDREQAGLRQLCMHWWGRDRQVGEVVAPCASRVDRLQAPEFIT